ncbi:MAG: response regulator transcription factor, partial [Achromobacter sp.]|nr:response regulator transcription factor [Achromobacter sp.]
MNVPIDQHAHCSRLRILVADDHHLVREGVKLVLSQRSLEHLVQVVAEATCAESVLTQLAAHEIDLLVLDLGMPGITGSRWIRALRDAHPELHIIVMTANQDTHTRDAVLAAGVEAYLLKQGETQTLLDAVNALA